MNSKVYLCQSQLWYFTDGQTFSLDHFALNIYTNIEAFVLHYKS